MVWYLPMQRSSVIHWLLVAILLLRAIFLLDPMDSNWNWSALLVMGPWIERLLWLVLQMHRGQSFPPASVSNQHKFAFLSIPIFCMLLNAHSELSTHPEFWSSCHFYLWNYLWNFGRFHLWDWLWTVGKQYNAMWTQWLLDTTIWSFLWKYVMKKMSMSCCSLWFQLSTVDCLHDQCHYNIWNFLETLPIYQMSPLSAVMVMVWCQGRQFLVVKPMGAGPNCHYVLVKSFMLIIWRNFSKWRFSSPEDCDPLYAPENGSFNSNDTHYGAEVKFSCVSGFMIDGEAMITCGLNGTWSADIPECIRKYAQLYLVNI